MLKISFLGGLGEFGRNMTIYESDGYCLIVDCGMMFPEADTFGVDRVIPDFQYILERKETQKFALLLTHAHEDHIGAVPFLLKQIDVPVFSSPFAYGLLEKKIVEMELDFPDFTDISKLEKINYGPFSIETVFVTHSIPEAYSVSLQCEDGRFLHSSDFKFDQTPLNAKITDYSKLQKIGSEGVTAILIDSTNAETSGIAGSEKGVFKNMEKYISSFKKRLIVTLFSTNIQRIQGVLSLAEKYDKKVAFLGRSLIGNIEVAERLGHLKYPPNVVIKADDIERMEDGEVVVIATGSQGEPFSALSRIAFDEMKELSIEKGDLVLFSARMIPGNEKRIGKIINQVYRKGGRVITPKDDPSVHVSGHASQEELKLMASWAKAKYYIPIHGEFRQLKENAELAKELGYEEENILINEVGDTLVFEKGKFLRKEKFPAGMVWLDGESGDPVGKLLLRDRRHLGNEGFVLPVVVVNSNEGCFEGEPEIIHRGYPPFQSQPDLLDEIKRSIKGLEKELTKAELADQNIVKARVKSSVKKSLKRREAKIPVVIPVVMEV